MIIRPEHLEDIKIIEEVNRQAFNGEGEVKLVNAIRESEHFVPKLSLVAEDDGNVVGHILFSEVHVIKDGQSTRVLALAPMAVLPEYHGKGIGSKLVEAGLESAKELNYPIVVVIGHPWFYPRFGFVPARPKGLDSKYKVPDEIFMVCELQENASQAVNGWVEYPSAFSNV